jgi:hypothetical protein
VLHFSIDELKPWAIRKCSVLVREFEAEAAAVAPQNRAAPE